MRQVRGRLLSLEMRFTNSFVLEDFQVTLEGQLSLVEGGDLRFDSGVDEGLEILLEGLFNFGFHHDALLELADVVKYGFALVVCLVHHRIINFTLK